MVRFDITGALAWMALTEKLLIARLSVTVKMHRLARGGVASAGDVAAFPNPAGPRRQSDQDCLQR